MFFCLLVLLNFSLGMASNTNMGFFSQTCTVGETMVEGSITGDAMGCPDGYYANDNTNGCVKCPYPFTTAYGPNVSCEGIQFNKGSGYTALAVVMSFICFVIGITMLRIKDSESLKISFASALIPAFDYATDVAALLTITFYNIMWYPDGNGYYVCTGLSPYTMVILFVIFIFVTPGIFFIKYLIEKRIESRVHSLFPFPLKKGEETEPEPQNSTNSYVHDICYVIWFLALCLPMLPWLMYGGLLYQINLIPISVHWNFWVYGWAGTDKFSDIENKHHLDIDRLKLCQNSHIFTEAIPMFAIQTWNARIVTNYLFPVQIISIAISGGIVFYALVTYLCERFCCGRVHKEMSLEISIQIPINLKFQEGYTFPTIEYLFYRRYNELGKLEMGKLQILPEDENDVVNHSQP